jgi:hypothetical protein
MKDPAAARKHEPFIFVLVGVGTTPAETGNAD